MAEERKGRGERSRGERSRGERSRREGGQKRGRAEVEKERIGIKQKGGEE